MNVFHTNLISLSSHAVSEKIDANLLPHAKYVNKSSVKLENRCLYQFKFKLKLELVCVQIILGEYAISPEWHITSTWAPPLCCNNSSTSTACCKQKIRGLLNPSDEAHLVFSSARPCRQHISERDFVTGTVALLNTDPVSELIFMFIFPPNPARRLFGRSCVSSVSRKEIGVWKLNPNSVD